MNKARNNYLMQLADNALRGTKALFKKDSSSDIDASYNGQIASLGVTIALSGLRPALAIYYQDSNSGSGSKVNRRAILEVIAEMIKNDKGRDLENANDADFIDAKTFLTYSFRRDLNSLGLKKLSREVVDCAIALKQVVRTYNLV